jgi:hypothetical protein
MQNRSRLVLCRGGVAMSGNGEDLSRYMDPGDVRVYMTYRVCCPFCHKWVAVKDLEEGDGDSFGTQLTSYFYHKDCPQSSEGGSRRAVVYKRCEGLYVLSRPDLEKEVEVIEQEAVSA